MLTIAAADKDRTAQLAGRYPDRKDVSWLAAQEQGREVGFLVTSESEDTLYLLEAEAQDDGVLEGLVRAALFSAYRAGRRQAVSASEGLFSLLRRLRFEERGSDRICMLSEFCNRPCSHGKAQS